MAEWIVEIKDGLPHLQRMTELVRCKDCRWREQEQPGMVYCPNVMGNWVEDDWFCADGERRDDER